MEQESTSKIFPSDVLKWMKKNAPPKMSLKLMQVCKYFQHKEFPYFVVKRIIVKVDRYAYWNLCEMKEEWPTFNDIPDNLWVTKQIYFRRCSFSSISLLVRKIVVCYISKLHLQEICMSLNDFKLVTSSSTIKKFEFRSSTITDENNEDASLESILECLLNVKKITIVDNIPKFSSVKAAEQLILPKLLEFNTRFTTNDVYIDPIIAFMEKNKHVSYILRFYAVIDLPDALKLESFIDRIVKAGDTSHLAPYIEFPDQDVESKKALMDLQAKYSLN